MTEKVYYVYTHFDPKTKETVYVGKGRGGRAWDVTRARGNHKDHQNWMTSLMHQGFIPSDWVEIIEKNLTEKEAFEKELNLIHEKGLIKFNRQQGETQHQAKMTNDQAIEAFKLVKEGIQHKIVAEKFGVSRTTISMLANRKNWKTVTAGVLI